MANLDFTIKQGDTLPHIVGRLPGVDLAGDSAGPCTVRFLMRDRQTRALKIAGDVIIDEANAGGSGEAVVRYPWVTADTNDPGWYEAEFEVTFPDGSIQTYPNYRFINVRVKPELG